MENKIIENKIQEEDSILNSNIVEYIEKFVNLGGEGNVTIFFVKKKKAMMYLVENYKGYPEMINLMVELLK